MISVFDLCGPDPENSNISHYSTLPEELKWYARNNPHHFYTYVDSLIDRGLEMTEQDMQRLTEINPTEMKVSDYFNHRKLILTREKMQAYLDDTIRQAKLALESQINQNEEL